MTTTKTSFEQALDNPELRNVFFFYLQKHHQAETLLFVEQVEKYFVLKSDDMRYNLAQQIVKQFLHKDSTCEINVPATLRDELLNKFATCTLTNCPRSLFEVVNDLILLQLKTETFSSFTKSTIYLDYVAQKTQSCKAKRQFKKSPKWLIEHATNPTDHDQMLDAVAESLWHLSNDETAEDIEKCTQIVKMLDTSMQIPTTPVAQGTIDDTMISLSIPSTIESENILASMASPASKLKSPALGPAALPKNQKVAVELDDHVEQTFRKVFQRNGLVMKKYKALLKTYKHTFLPAELVAYMTTELNMNKERAMEYIAEFEKRKYMAPLIKSFPFEEQSKAVWRMLKKRRVVILGGGFAGSIVANGLKDKFDVMLVDKKQQFEYIMDFPLLAVNPSCYQKISHPFEKITNITHIYGTATTITPREVLIDVPSITNKNVTTLESLTYDYLVVATGARCQLPFPVDDAGMKRCVFSYSSKSILKSFAAQQEAKTIMVLGAGPTGIEVAAELALRYKDTQIVIISRPHEFLEKECKTAHKYVVKHLSRFKNLKWHLGKEVQSICDNTVTVKTVKKSKSLGANVSPNSEEKYVADLFFVCCGTKARTEHMEQEMAHALDLQKRVIVNNYLQVAKGVNTSMEYYDHIFAVGDIVNLPEDQLAQIAMLHANAVVKNVRAVDKKYGKEKMSFYQPKCRVQIVSTGEGKAIMFQGDAVISEGLFSAKIKQWLRTKVMLGVKQ